jgi:hypothetical protein
VTYIDKFLSAVVSGDGIPEDIYSDGAVLDATVPGWRFTARGAPDIAATYAGWFADPATFDELDRHPVDGGEIVRYFLTWTQNGVPHGAHHVHLLTTDASGRISSDTVFCGGRWDATLLAQMAEADR